MQDFLPSCSSPADSTIWVNSGGAVCVIIYLGSQWNKNGGKIILKYSQPMCTTSTQTLLHRLCCYCTIFSILSASSPRRASPITSSRVGHVLGRLSLSFTNPSSHWLISFSQHFTGSFGWLDSIQSSSGGLKLSPSPTFLQRDAMSSITNSLSTLPLADLYLRQFKVDTLSGIPVERQEILYYYIMLIINLIFNNNNYSLDSYNEFSARFHYNEHL